MRTVRLGYFSPFVESELEVLDCEDILPHLPVEEQKALLDMRQYFMEKAGGLTE